MKHASLRQNCRPFGIVVLVLGIWGAMSGCRAVSGQNQITDDTPVASQPAVPRNLVERIDAFMMEQVNDGYSGALVVEKDGQLIVAQGYGWRDRTTFTPVTPQTVFDIASVTKQFTAAAILKLEEQGQLTVEDSISAYFETVPEDKQGITLHQLLTHTAGLPEDLVDDYAPVLRDEYIDIAMRTPLVHPPGETYSYSNAGYGLLAAIIERVTGQSYEAYLREVLFEPAGMTDTGYLLPNWPADQLAHGYEKVFFWNQDRGTPLDEPFAEDGPYWNLRGSGGILSTVRDMHQWHKALKGTSVLSEASKAKLFTPYVDEGYEEASFYGYGWVIMPTSRGTTLQTHNGGNGLFYADIHRYVEDDVMIFITSNAGKPDATELSWQIADLIFE
ncbi:MAG: serine hydrolase domain-containing protein [Cyanobacteria bacterium J06559_3]